MGLYYLRAIYSLFVFDEATTFLSYVHNNKSIPGDAFWSANNQLIGNVIFFSIPKVIAALLSFQLKD